MKQAEGYQLSRHDEPLGPFLLKKNPLNFHVSGSSFWPVLECKFKMYISNRWVCHFIDIFCQPDIIFILFFLCFLPSRTCLLTLLCCFPQHHFLCSHYNSILITLARLVEGDVSLFHLQSRNFRPITHLQFMLPKFVWDELVIRESWLVRLWFTQVDFILSIF